MIKVTAVRANEDYTLDLTFSDGSVKRFDVKSYLKYEVFKELKAFTAPETLFVEGETIFDSQLHREPIAPHKNP